MRKDVESYALSSDYDFSTAKHLLKTGRYIYVVFMCHLSMEKLLKAIYAKKFDRSPPKTHNLLFLAKETSTELPAELFDFVSRINNASVVTRYPENFKELVDSYPLQVAKEYMNATQEVLSWLKRHMRSI